MNDPTSIYVDIYGYRAELRSSSAAVLAGLSEDFAFFRRDSLSSHHVIELVDADPPYDDLPSASATVYTPRNVSYRVGDLSLVDYSGRALGVHDRNNGNFSVYSRDSDLLYEAAYLFLLSQSGEALDARGLHRVHALAVSVGQCAALVLLPMGGGKSTLGSELLQFPEIMLLSDDSPIIDRKGDIYAFPLRLGLLPGSAAPVPPQEMRMIRRMEFGPKLLVRYDYFADRVSASASPCVVFLGKRSLGKSCRIHPVHRLIALRAMVSNCIVGLGLFQGMEFVFQRTPRELLGKISTGFSRLFASARLIWRSRTYSLILGLDSKENARVVFQFLQAVAKEGVTANLRTQEEELEHR